MFILVMTIREGAVSCGPPTSVSIRVELLIAASGRIPGEQEDRKKPSLNPGYQNTDYTM